MLFMSTTVGSSRLVAGARSTGDVPRPVIPDLSPQLEHLERAFVRSWSRETSYDPENWSKLNSAWGQCAVTALIIQDLLGGDLIVGEVNGVPHYWNRLTPRRRVDLTAQQFGPEIKRTKGKKCDREFVLSFPDTIRRYRRLRTSVLQKLQTADARLKPAKAAS
jgi:hypothetical protein